jgi:hypothetical protein
VSRQIDEKIVEMKFDNSNFEKNVSESRRTLSKLKEDLKLDNVSSGMNVLGEAAEKVSIKFDALRIAAEVACGKIVSYFIDAGKQLVSSLTIDQISAGFEKYASKTAAVQTIMAATRSQFEDTGEQMEYVSDQLNKLNWFTDETSYNFVDMVSNIGKFTSAGVKLDNAVTAMQGIADWAAISGVNAEGASRAMYNLSQAMGVGYIQKIDWKSLENLNMSTIELKQHVIDAAVELGTLIDIGNGSYIAASGDKGEVSVTNFAEALKDKWFTSDVLMKVLDEYGSFTNALYKATEETGLTATELLGYTEDYANGVADLSSISKETGKSVEELTELLSGLSSEEYDLGRRSLQAAQEAKTFREAIDSVKDAVSTGWMTSFEKVFGNYNEAKKLWTQLANELWDVFAAGGEERNALLEEWRTMVDDASGETRTGRELLLDSFWNLFHSIVDGINIVKEAFNEIFPKKTAKDLFDFSRKLEEFTAKLHPSEETANKLKSTFKGLFAVLNIVKQLLSAITTRILGPAVKGFGSLGDKVLDITGNIGEWLTKLDDFIEQNDIFGKSIDSVIGFVVTAKDKIIEFFKAVKEYFHIPDFDVIKQNISDLIDKLKSKFSTPGLDKASSTLDGIKSAASSVAGWLIKIWERIKSIFKGIKTAFERTNIAKVLTSLAKLLGKSIAGTLDIILNVFERLIDMLSKADFNGLIDLINSLSFGGIAAGITKFLMSFNGNNTFLGGLKGIIEGISGVLNGVQNNLKSLQETIKAKAIKEIAISVAILTASLLVLSLIDSSKLAASLGAITMMLSELVGSMALLSNTTKSSNAMIVNSFTNTMIKLSIAMLLLSISLKKIASIDSDKLTGSVIAISILLEELVGSVKLLSYDSQKGTQNVTKGITSLIALAIAIKILASAAKSLGSLNTGDLIKGLIGVGALLSAIIGFIQLVNTQKSGMIKTAISVVILAVGLKILASAVKSLGMLDLETLIKGLLAIGGLLAGIAGFTKIVDTKRILSTGIALILISTALNILVPVMRSFGSMSWGDIIKGLLSVGVLLAEIGGFTKLVDTKRIISVGLALILVGSALVIISKAMNTLGSMSLGGIVKGLVSIALLLGGMVAFSKTVDKKSMLSIGASMLLIASALAILAPVMKSIGELSWEDLAKSLLFVAGVFVIFGVAAYALGEYVGIMAGIGAAMLLMGAGLALVGAALWAVSIAITNFCLVADVFAYSLNIVISAILSQLPMIAKKTAEFVTILITGIAGNILELGSAIKDIILKIIEIIVECVPELVEGLLTVIDSLLGSLVEYVPSIVDKLFTLIIKILDGITEKLPELVESVVNLLVTFFSSVYDSMSKFEPEILEKALKGVGIMTIIMTLLANLGALAPAAAIGVIGTTAVIAEIAFMIAALGELQQLPGLNWLIGEGGKLLSTIGGVLGDFVGSIVGGFAKGMTDFLPSIGTNLSTFMTNLQPFINGAMYITPSMMDGVKSIADVILVLTAASVLDGIASFMLGGTSISGFGEELAALGPNLRAYAESVSGLGTEDFKASSEAVKMLAEMASYLPRTGGVVEFFAGNNDIDDFGARLVPFGIGLCSYAEVISTLSSSAIEKIALSAQAAKALSELASDLPNTDGVVSWFAGNNDIDDFGHRLAPFAVGLRDYAIIISTLTDDDIAKVKISVEAAKALSELASDLPNTDGVVSWFAGNNDIDDFGHRLAPFAVGLRDYAIIISTLTDDDIAKVKISVEAAKALSELASDLPNTDGVVSWFAGNNDIDDFGKRLKPFGKGLKSYAESISGFTDDDISRIKLSAEATKALSDMAKDLPNEGGLISVFAGDNDIGKFGESLKIFGDSFKSYANSISGIKPEVVIASANAAKSLVELSEMSENLDTGGLFTDGVLENLGEDLSAFGEEFIDYFDLIKDVDSYKISAVSNATSSIVDIMAKMSNINSDNLAKATAQLVASGPDLTNSAWYYVKYSESISDFKSGAVFASSNLVSVLSKIGDSTLSIDILKDLVDDRHILLNVGKDLSEFAPYFVKYGNTISDVDNDNVSQSASAISALVNIADNASSIGGLKSLFGDDHSLIKFGSELSNFAPLFVSYSKTIKDIDNESVKDSANVITMVIDIVKNLSGKEWESIVSNLNAFGNNLDSFGKSFYSYYKSISSIVMSDVSQATYQITKILDVVKDITNMDIESIDNFGNSLMNFGNTGIKKFASAFTSDNNIHMVEKAANDLINKAYKVLGSNDSYAKSFENGVYFVKGFIDGLINEEGLKLVKNAGAVIGKRARKGLEESLDIESPSKIMYEDGRFSVMGFVNAFSDNMNSAFYAGYGIGDQAREGLNDAISQLCDTIDSDLEYDPVIRPVIDLSDIEYGVSKMDRYFSKGRTIDLANSASVSIPTKTTIQNEIPYSSESDNIVRELRSELSGIVDRLNGLTVVMDTGKLVGSLVDPMDYALGAKAIKTERRR